MKKQLKCPDCGQECQLGRYNNHESYNMLSIKRAGEYFLIGIHYANPEFGHYASFKAGRKQLLKLIFEEDYSSEIKMEEEVKNNEKLDSIKISKGMNGKYSWEIKIYYDNTKRDSVNVIEQIRLIDIELQNRFSEKE